MIRLPRPIVEAMERHASNEHPDEACGLIAGESEEARFFYPLTNVSRSPVTYTVDPAGHIGALRHAERCGWRLVGVFHTHPNASAVPSSADVVGALEPDWLHVIRGEGGDYRAWALAAGSVRELGVIQV